MLKLKGNRDVLKESQKLKVKTMKVLNAKR